jgi:hypothetical protein
MRGLRQRRVQLTACAPDGVLTRADPARQVRKRPSRAGWPPLGPPFSPVRALDRRARAIGRPAPGRVAAGRRG